MLEMIYLDYNATTPVLPEVLEAMLPYFGAEWGNPSSGYAFAEFARKGIEEARLATPFPADERLAKKARKILEKRLNKKVVLSSEIDPDLIGGFVLYTRNRVIDASLRGKLANLKKELTMRRGNNA